MDVTGTQCVDTTGIAYAGRCGAPRHLDLNAEHLLRSPSVDDRSILALKADLQSREAPSPPGEWSTQCLNTQ